MKFREVSYFEKNAKSTRPIWGINTSTDSELGVAGEILIAIPNPHGGKPDRLLVAQTWLPQDLTRIVGRKRLLESTEFRSAVANGLVSLIDAETAAQLLRQDGVDEEKERIRERNKQIRDAGQARTLADSKTEIVRADGVVDEDDSEGRNKTVIIDHNENVSVAKAAANGVEEYEPGISMEFKMWADRVVASKDILAQNSIRSRRKFSGLELRYLARVLPKTFTKAGAMVNANIKK